MTVSDLTYALKGKDGRTFICKADIGRVLGIKRQAVDNLVAGLDYYELDKKGKFYAVKDIKNRVLLTRREV